MEIPYYRQDLDRKSLCPSQESVNELFELLDDPKILEEINKGNVTLSMIRPNVGPEANIHNWDDLTASDKIEEMIGELGVMAKFSFIFTPSAVEKFYEGDPKERMLEEPPKTAGDYDSRWPEFRDFMSSGPTTALLLYSPGGDAVTKWRGHLGHWNIDEVRDPSTIRGALGMNKYNNLVHGSDGPEEIKRELGIILECFINQA